VIVNDVMARAFWPGEDPLGKTILVKDGPAERQVHDVVGVVKDVKYRHLRDETGPMFYRPAFQTRSIDAMTLHVRAGREVEPVVSAIRRTIRSVDPRLSLFGITTLEAQLDAAFAHPRLAAAMTGAFGLLALVLSAVGVYGVTALAASRQTRSIGIRMALGAQPSDIVRAIGRRSAAIVMTGLGFGLLAAYIVAHATGAMLVGVTPTDAVTFAATSLVLTAVSLVAIYVPARSATKLDAVRAIRGE
jgi:ABC-type antimicrobial peptide transport system permease subunit